MPENTKKRYSPKEIAAFNGLFQLAGSGRSFSGIKVQDIATAAGIGKGTLYAYFASKEDILSSAILFALEQLVDQMGHVLQQGLSFRQILEQFFGSMGQDSVQMISSLAMLVSSMSQEQKEEIQVRSKMQMGSIFARMKQAETQLFAVGRRSGEIDPQLADDFCEYVFISALFGQTAKRIYAQKENGCWLTEMICRALRP